MSERAGICLRNAAKHEAFVKNGYAILPLLPPEAVDNLLLGYKGFEEAHNALQLPFATTSHSNNEALISAVDALILTTAAPFISNHIRDYELLFSNFLVKNCHPNSVTPPHQDVTLVDENTTESCSIWIALEDVDEHNGCLKVLPQSHRFHRGIRPNPSYPWRFRNVEDRIARDMVSIPMKKGEALIFSHALIHGSNANTTQKARVAAVIALYPIGAAIYHYQVDHFEATTVHKYGMDKAAFIRYAKGAAPTEGRLLATLPFEAEAVTLRQYEKMRGVSSSSLLLRLKNSIFGHQ